ncbi:MAG: glycerophosphodiester phosphodiesterase [Bacteroidales bacterium]|jgi:glycerophosphoryl diester phosphodiesterase|nr:glycerophosphodiester phosphodiesterase [Bacteroidales bacterium]MCI2122048.1 glycerophosphodiester phosphodiesterase [Bacteroidales bacterium]MCI2145345.1 glycerophosphodiester phosphodiesterase [Bacteroidales bacterium]
MPETIQKIICHRGMWSVEGSYENSLSSLANTQKNGFYGSEFDLNMTSDGILIVNHDPTIQGHVIEQTPYDTIKVLKLPNGEPIPTFEQYLVKGGKNKKTMMVCEMKKHSTDSLTIAAVDKAVELVKKHNMEDQMIYISFSLHACQEYARLQPDNEVAYLGGKMAPQAVRDSGVNGIDYQFAQFIMHPEWVKQAHDLGMKVNVWTVDDASTVLKMANLGVDYITTNKPEMARDLLIKTKKTVMPAKK